MEWVKEPDNITEGEISPRYCPIDFCDWCGLYLCWSWQK